MPQNRAILTTVTALFLVVIAGKATSQTGLNPINDLPNPYRTVRDWGQPPGDGPWAAVTAVEVAPDGSIYVIHRCSANSCAGRTEPPILKFDKSGKLLQELGRGNVCVSRTARRWTRRATFGSPTRRPKDGQGLSGVQVQPGWKGSDDARQSRRRQRRARICSMNPPMWSSPPTAISSSRKDTPAEPGQRPRLEVLKGRKVHQVVGKNRIRSRRIQHRRTRSPWTPADGCLLATARTTASRSSIRTGSTSTHGTSWAGPAASSSTDDDTMYVADSESWGPGSARLEEGHPHRKRQRRIGQYFIEDMESTTIDHSGAEGVGVDAEGNVYGAVVRRQMLEKHIRK